MANPTITIVGRVGQDPVKLNGGGVRLRIVSNDRVKNDSTGSWDDKDTSWWKGILPPNDVIIELEIPFKFLVGVVSRISPRIISFIYPIFRFFRPDKAFLDEILTSHGVDVVHLPFQDGLLIGDLLDLPNLRLAL